MASFTKEVNPRLAKRPLKTNGRLANRRLTSLVKEDTGVAAQAASNNGKRQLFKQKWCVSDVNTSTCYPVGNTDAVCYLVFTGCSMLNMSACCRLTIFASSNQISIFGLFRQSNQFHQEQITTS